MAMCNVKGLSEAVNDTLQHLWEVVWVDVQLRPSEDPCHVGFETKGAAAYQVASQTLSYRIRYY